MIPNPDSISSGASGPPGLSRFPGSRSESAVSIPIWQVILRFHGLATQTKSLLSLARRATPDARRISELAEQAPLFQAQRWFARERHWINEQHLAICRIAAPTFFEEKRAGWFVERLRSLRWEATLDRAGNVLATFPGSVGQPLLAVLVLAAAVTSGYVVWRLATRWFRPLSPAATNARMIANVSTRTTMVLSTPYENRPVG